MYDEIGKKRCLKYIISFGIPKIRAIEIVEMVFEMKSDNKIACINYAVDLVYGLGLSQRKEKKII